MSLNTFSRSVLKPALLVMNVMAISAAGAYANEPNDSGTGFDSLSEDALSLQLTTEADQLESVSTTLGVQSVQISSETQQNVTELSRDIREQAAKPGLKERLKRALKAAEHVGIYALEGVGYAGNASVEILMAPYTAGSDLVAASITGKDYHNTPASQQNEAVMFAGGVGGTATWYMTVLEVSEASSVALPAAILGGAGIILVNEAVCSHRKDARNYCKHIAAMDGNMESGAAKAGAFPGKAVHFVGKKVFGTIIHVFRHP